MSEDARYNIPLGLCKQAVMKLDSFITDIHEIKEDENLNPEDRETFEQIAEISGTIMAAIINLTTKEMEKDEFLTGDIAMDSIESYPEE